MDTVQHREIPTNSTPSPNAFPYGSQKPMSAFHSIESLMTPSGQSNPIGQTNRMGGAYSGHYQEMHSSYNTPQAFMPSLWPTTWASPYNTATSRESSITSHVSPTYDEAKLRGKSDFRPNHFPSQPSVSDLSLNPFQYESQSHFRDQQTTSPQTSEGFPSVEQHVKSENGLNDEILDVESYSPFNGSGNSTEDSDVIQETNPGPCSSSSTGYSSGYQSCDGSADSPTYRPVSSFPLGTMGCASPAVASFSDPAPNLPPCQKQTSSFSTFSGPAATFTSFPNHASPAESPSGPASAMTPYQKPYAAFREPAPVPGRYPEPMHATSAFPGSTATYSKPTPATAPYPEQPRSTAWHQETARAAASYPEPSHATAGYPQPATASAAYTVPHHSTGSYPGSSYSSATFPDQSPSLAPALESIPEAASTNEPAPTKKPRIKYTPAQLNTLEAFFAETPYPDWDELEELSKKLDIAEQKIKVWFQNKRARWRKKNAAAEKAQAATHRPVPHPSHPPTPYGLPHAFPPMYPPVEKRPAAFYNRPAYNVW